jgi:hypothetical protein
MTTAEQVYEMLLTMPEDRAVKVLEFVHSLRKKESAKEDKLDFRNAAGLGQEIWRSVNAEEYLDRERDSWD